MWKNEICTLSFVIVVYLLPSFLLSFSSSLYHQVSMLNFVKMTEKVDFQFAVSIDTNLGVNNNDKQTIDTDHKQ